MCTCMFACVHVRIQGDAARDGSEEVRGGLGEAGALGPMWRGVRPGVHGVAVPMLRALSCVVGGLLTRSPGTPWRDSLHLARWGGWREGGGREDASGVLLWLSGGEVKAQLLGHMQGGYGVDTGDSCHGIPQEQLSGDDTWRSRADMSIRVKGEGVPSGA